MHIKDLLIAMSRRAIIYDNIEKEIEYIYELDIADYERKLKEVKNEQERALLKRPRKPNLNQISIIKLKITHKKRNIDDIKQ